MFYRDGCVFRSSCLAHPGVRHAFSTRLGGVSTHPYTQEMNLAGGREDTDDVVLENMERFAHMIAPGVLHCSHMTTAAQIHSARVRVLHAENCGEGVHRPTGEPCDGFVTDTPGVLPVIRVADCVPILLCGSKADNRPVIGAVHAGWRGSAAGIAAEVVRCMVDCGAVPETICAAIGAHIGLCCYTVRSDFVRSVAETAGEAFARRFCIPAQGGGYHADLTGMNLFYLHAAGVATVDVSQDCTMCRPFLYHSHRATNGLRGAMGAGIAIIPTGTEYTK